MQRGDGPKRRTEMKRTGFVRKQPSPKLSGSSLSRAARKPAPRKPIRSRPKPATPEEVEARRVVMQRADGRCEGCGREVRLDWSHRVGRGQCGPWHPANGLALCRSEHAWAGEHPAAARERFGWILRSTDDFLTYPAWLWGREWCLLGPNGEVWPINDIPDEEAS